MTTYYIDANRGDDGNSGLSRLDPWKSLSKLNRALFAGDVIALSDDSVFVIPTIAGNIACAQTWQGTPDSPIIITSYPSGGYGPVIDYRESIASTEWVWDAVKSGWYIERSIAFDAFSYVNLGGQWGVHMPASVSSTLLTDGDYAFSGSGPFRFYVKSPQQTNPTDYFGFVKIAGTQGAITMAVGCWDNVAIENLTSVGGKLIQGYSSAAGTRTVEFRNLKGEQCGVLVGWQTSGSSYWNIDVHDCQSDGSPVCSVHLYEMTNGTINQGRIYRNRFNGDCSSRTNGAIYIQADNVSIFENEIYGCRQATRNQLYDGGGIYIEDGSNGCLIYRNHIHDMPLAFVDNSGYSNAYYSNVVANCAAGIWVTDEGNHNATQTSYVNNSHFFNMVGGDVNQPSRRCMFWSYESTTPPFVLNIKNNIAVYDFAGATAIQVPNVCIASIEANCISGAASLAKTAGGVDKPTNRTLTSDPMMSSDFTLPESSPCRKYGRSTVAGMADYHGKLFNNSTPCVGAIEMDVVCAVGK